MAMVVGMVVMIIIDVEDDRIESINSGALFFVEIYHQVCNPLRTKLTLSIPRILRPSTSSFSSFSNRGKFYLLQGFQFLNEKKNIWNF